MFRVSTILRRQPVRDLREDPLGQDRLAAPHGPGAQGPHQEALGGRPVEAARKSQGNCNSTIQDDDTLMCVLMPEKVYCTSFSIHEPCRASKKIQHKNILSELSSCPLAYKSKT